MQFSGCELLQKFRKKLQKKEHSAGVVVFVTHTLSTSALCYKVLLMEVCTTKIETATRETNTETKLCSSVLLLSKDWTMSCPDTNTENKHAQTKSW